MKISRIFFTVAFAFTIIMAQGGHVCAVAKEGQLKDIGNGTCQDNKTGMVWQIDKSKRFAEQQDVDAYLKKLNEGEYSDWRLPAMNEIKELRLVFDRKNNGDCNLPRLKSWCWADKAPFNARSGKLEPNDECGGGYEFVSKAKGYVRAVRP